MKYSGREGLNDAFIIVVVPR